MQVMAETHVDPEPVMLKVGSRVRLKDKDLYGFVRCVHVHAPNLARAASHTQSKLMVPEESLSFFLSALA